MIKECGSFQDPLAAKDICPNIAITEEDTDAVLKGLQHP
jgi:hypothetical protein